MGIPTLSDSVPRNVKHCLSELSLPCIPPLPFKIKYTLFDFALWRGPSLDLAIDTYHITCNMILDYYTLVLFTARIVFVQYINH